MTEPMERELEELLYQMGIYLVQSGYGIVAEAARLAVEEPGRLKSLMQEFYPEVGARCNCAWSCVERSIRGTATRAWESNAKLLSSMAGREITQPPTAGDFLCILRHCRMKKRDPEVYIETGPAAGKWDGSCALHLGGDGYSRDVDLLLWPSQQAYGE